MEHEPCRLLSNLYVLGNLVATDSVLAVGDHPGCSEPLVQRDRRVFHHSSDLNREFALGVMAGALPSPASAVETAHTGRVASGANDRTVRPPAHCKVVNAVIGIREVNDCFLQALRFLAHIAPNCLSLRLKQVESNQLLPLFGIDNLPRRHQPGSFSHSSLVFPVLRGWIHACLGPQKVKRLLDGVPIFFARSTPLERGPVITPARGRPQFSRSRYSFSRASLAFMVFMSVSVSFSYEQAKFRGARLEG